MWGLDPAQGAAVELHDRDRARTTTSCASASQQAAAYPVLKVKLGTDHDAQIIRTVRDAAPDKVLRVDANAAWTPKHALRMIDVLVECGVEYVEQPLPRTTSTGCASSANARRSRSSPTSRASWRPTSRGSSASVDGINIKLSKCGGLREALRMIATARSHGMLVMAAA